MRKVGKTNARGQKRSLYQTINNDPSMTVQSDAHLADINQILRKFEADGIKSLDEAELMFADVSTFGDYHDVMLQVREADVAFHKLPSKVREIFDHSVEKWLDTAHDEDKRDALVEAGFIKRVEVAETGNEDGGAEADRTPLESANREVAPERATGTAEAE